MASIYVSQNNKMVKKVLRQKLSNLLENYRDEQTKIIIFPLDQMTNLSPNNKEQSNQNKILLSLIKDQITELKSNETTPNSQSMPLAQESGPS